MIPYEEVQITPELREKIDIYRKTVAEFRSEGALDDVSLAKLEEYFKASHIYHSAGIEGNRLTMQETALVLTEGIDIRGEKLADVVEVKNLGSAFDFLKVLSDSQQTIRETDIRDLHKLLVGNDPDKSPGEYRRVGVVILGSEHKPPEPFEVPPRMHSLISWINQNILKNPIIVAAVAHHELENIHPFVDGNGRVGRLLLNLILMRTGFPICNIKRGPEKASYYEALGYADVGIYDTIVDMTLGGSSELFAEYVRIRTETKRMADWSQHWGTKAQGALKRRELKEMELWQSRIRQVFLEFDKAAELLNEEMAGILEVQFYDYKNEISFEKYQTLKEKGNIPQGNAFSVGFTQLKDGRRERFMFRYFRNRQKFIGGQKKVIPFEVNYYEGEAEGYVRLSELSWAKKIRLRELYFNEPDGDFEYRWFNSATDTEMVMKGHPISEAVQWFFDDVLKNIFELG
jgi:Fic family protein